jgi:hypothetical protein
MRFTIPRAMLYGLTLKAIFYYAVYPLRPFVTSLNFYSDELLAPRPTPKLEAQPLVGRPLLAIQYIRRYAP